VPTYEYRCTSCSHRYETHEGFDSPAKQDCPLCGNLAKRILFPPPIVFKGSGFYSTDSKKGKSATIGADGDGGGESSKKDESSPAPTADANGASQTAPESKTT
jgi:putative FmdB family regulatory protein